MFKRQFFSQVFLCSMVVSVAGFASPAVAADDPTLGLPVQTFNEMSGVLSATPADQCTQGRAANPDEDSIGRLLRARTNAMTGTVITVSPGSCDKVNQAVKSLPASGGTIRLEAGEYDCASPIIVDRDNVALIGAGRGSTLIRANDGKAMPVVVLGDVINGDMKNGIPYPNHTTHNLIFGGASIDGNFHSSQNPGGLECWNPSNNQSLTCGSDVGFYIRNNGLTIRRVEGALVSNIDSKANYSGGIVLEKLNKNIVMDDFSATGNFFDGFAGYETSGSVFSHFNLHENIFSGISTDCFFEGNTFHDGSVSHNGDNGVFSADVGHNRFLNVQALNNHNLGYYIDGHRDQGVEVPGTCDGNEIIGGEIAGGNGNINVNFGCKDTLVQGVKMSNARLNCTIMAPNGTYSISDSSCSDGASASKVVNATH